jgi:hypothetical protein
MQIAVAVLGAVFCASCARCRVLCRGARVVPGAVFYARCQVPCAVPSAIIGTFH